MSKQIQGYQQTTPAGVTVISPTPLSGEDMKALDAHNADAERRIKAMIKAVKS